jgi:acyl-CoA synthetase (AMP-forming)/AMP-acid ligase II
MEALGSTRHIGRLLQRLGEQRGARPAIVDAEGATSWSEFARRLRQVANALLSLGLRPGDRAALLLPDSRAYLEADYGTMSAGLVRVPIDPRLPAADVASLLRSSGARALIAAPGLVSPDLRSAAPDLEFVLSSGAGARDGLDFEALIASASDQAAPDGDPEDLATLNYSGGTTGKPKGVALRHRNLCAVLEHTAQAFDIRADGVFLNVRPLWPIAQIVMMSHLTAGGAVVLGGRFDAAAYANVLQASGATRSSLVPTQLFRLLDHLRPNDSRMRGVEAIYIGGSRLPGDMFRRALDLIGPRVGVLYGMTEAPISCYLPPQTAAVDEEARLSVGAPCPDCEVKIDANGDPTADPDATGEVIVRGEHVMQGYWRDGAASEAALRNGWLRTGDLGAFDAAGRLRIVGRIKDVIRSGAQSIVPAEVEDALMRHPAVLEAAVIGLPDPEWGEAATAFVALKPGEPADAGALLAYCKSVLAGFKTPRAIHFVERLPRSHYGKVLRDRLLGMSGGA